MTPDTMLPELWAGPGSRFSSEQYAGAKSETICRSSNKLDEARTGLWGKQHSFSISRPMQCATRANKHASRTTAAVLDSLSGRVDHALLIIVRLAAPRVRLFRGLRPGHQGHGLRDCVVGQAPLHSSMHAVWRLNMFAGVLPSRPSIAS